MRRLAFPLLLAIAALVLFGQAATSTPKRCSHRFCWSAPSRKALPPAARPNRGHGRTPGRWPA